MPNIYSSKKNYQKKILKKILEFCGILFLCLNFNLSSAFAKKNLKNNLEKNKTEINSFNANDNSKSTTLPAITVTAQKYNDSYDVNNSSSSLRINKKLLETPQSIAIVGQQEIRDRNIVNLEEATRFIPSVNIRQGEGNRDQVSIRGQDTTADFFLDGARDDMQYFRDFYNIEQVEFLKGPNALSFGRGGSGGVINRISKLANGDNFNKLVLSGGSFENRRAEADLSRKINDKLFVRMTGVYEKSQTFRDYGNLEKYGFNPTATIILGKNTDLKLGYEHFSDNRFNDRGLPSQNGLPVKVRASRFVGNPNEYGSDTRLDSVFSILNHEFDNKIKLRNYTRFTSYDKYYKNAYANSAVNSSGNFNLASYDNDQNRKNFTNQTDLSKKFEIFNTQHEILLGSEISHQASSVIRNDGYFNGTSTSQTISIFGDINSTPISYQRTQQNSNFIRILSGYLQDNIVFNKYFEANIGARIDNFDINLVNKYSNQKFGRNENLFSPKLALIFKPQKNIANYISYSTSYLPSAGDQFNSLDAKSQTLKAEKLQNYELGSKWDINDKFNISGALFILDRTNTRANDPSGSGFFVLTGASRVKGLELSATGKVTNKLNLIAGFAHLDAEVTSATSTASKGKKLALTPQNKFSLFTKYDFTEKFGASLGFIQQSSQYASVDNSVKIKAFNRFDGGLYYKINDKTRAQLNIENIFNKKYFLTAHNNNNLQPGSVRALKASLAMEF